MNESMTKEQILTMLPRFREVRAVCRMQPGVISYLKVPKADVRSYLTIADLQGKDARYATRITCDVLYLGE